MDHLLEITLLGLLVYQQVYYSRQIHKLIDKLMSRNYHEYKQAERPPEPFKVKLAPEETPEDMGALMDFNPL
jgi:hypothetical protein